jgi:phosphate transport system ATP-binding protein
MAIAMTKPTEQAAGTTAQPPIIDTEDVHLFYGSNEALKGISMSFKENEITALIGPSGCGKSTYLRTLNRMNDLIPNVTIKGKVDLKGQDIYASNMDTVQLRKEVGMVFQQPNPFPFSIYDNVTYGLRIAGVKDRGRLDEAVETALRQAAIWDELKDKLHQSAMALSGGQQQRVCIARVLAVKPDVILLDEPTSALDPISSSQIENMLVELKKNYTIILVTHNMAQASRISDRTAFFLQGHLIEYNDTKTIFLNPQKKETEDYISGRFG